MGRKITSVSRNKNRLQETSSPPQPLTIKGAEVDRTDSQIPRTTVDIEPESGLKMATVGGRKGNPSFLLEQTAKESCTQLCPLTQARKELRGGVLTIVCNGNATQAGKKGRQRVVKTAQKITNTKLPTADSIYMQQRWKTAENHQTPPSPSSPPAQAQHGGRYNHRKHHISITLFLTERLMVYIVCSI